MSIQLQPFFELSLDCLCIANYEGFFENVNPAFIALLGYSEEELKSKRISEFIYAEDMERTAAYRAKLKENIPLVNFENRYVCKSGKLVWLHWTSIPVKNERLIYAIAKNITREKELEKKRMAHVHSLGEVNKKLMQLNYTTTHDLRSPVNNLMSLVNLIDTSKIDDDLTSKLLGYIRVSAQNLQASLNAYIDAVKQKKMSGERLEEVNFPFVLTKVRKSIGSLIQEAGVVFDIDFTGLETIFFNTVFMESIFLNLITNSITYAQPTIPPVISICTKKINGAETLIYADNGLGFDMQKVGHLVFKFNQNFHGNEASKGVGLYLVHSHVTSLGGTISVDSQANVGTTFTIKFTS